MSTHGSIEAAPIPERDPSKPAEAQGLFRKFIVERTDGSSAPGGKHAECETFVLDVTHDPHAGPALAAYADSVEATHPALAADLRQRYELRPRGWSTERRAELGRLERLLREVAGLNNTTRVLDVMRKCIDEAKALVDIDLDANRDPLSMFLIRQAIGYPANEGGTAHVEPEVFVVVASHDGVDADSGPLIWETYVRKASRAEAEKSARAFTASGRYGACRIGRVIFEGDAS